MSATPETRDLQLAFWRSFANAAAEVSAMPHVQPRSRSALVLGSLGTGAPLIAAMSVRQHWVQIETYLQGPRAAERFDAFAQRRERIEARCGAALTWRRQADGAPCQIAWRSSDSDPADKANWSRQHAWLVHATPIFSAAMRDACP